MRKREEGGRRMNLGSSLDDLLGDLGLTPDTDSVVVSDLGEQLLLGPGLGEVLDLVSLSLEHLDGSSRDVFEEKDLDLSRSERFQRSGLTRIDERKVVGGEVGSSRGGDPSSLAEGRDGRGREVGSGRGRGTKVGGRGDGDGIVGVERDGNAEEGKKRG